MEVITQIFVNISYVTYCIDPDIESHKRKINSLNIEFITKTKFGKKDMFYVLVQEIFVNRDEYMFQILGTNLKYNGELQAVLEIFKIFTLVAGMG